jgi:hypothetical protein
MLGTFRGPARLGASAHWSHKLVMNEPAASMKWLVNGRSGAAPMWWRAVVLDNLKWNSLEANSFGMCHRIVELLASPELLFRAAERKGPSHRRSNSCRTKP